MGRRRRRGKGRGRSIIHETMTRDSENISPGRWSARPHSTAT